MAERTAGTLMNEEGPLHNDYGPWSPWITSTSYCEHAPTGEAGYRDQYRHRSASNERSGQEWTEYGFRTIESESCGGDPL